MGGLFDIYVLSDDRSREMVYRFLDHFLPRRKEAADDYVVPNNSDQPKFCFDTAERLLSHLEHSWSEPHAIYWLSEASGDPRCAMVFPTSDGKMIFGLSVEQNERGFLSGLMAFLGEKEGYVDFEAPPPDNTAAFKDAVRKSNERPGQT